MTSKKIIEQAKLMEPLLRIGKNGLSEGAVSEIKKQLLKKKMIKIKFLKSALEGMDRKRLIEEIVLRTKSEVVYAAGFVVAVRKI